MILATVFLITIINGGLDSTMAVPTVPTTESDWISMDYPPNKSRDHNEEITGSSGDGESIDLKRNFFLIDDNGDIHTGFPSSLDPNTNVSEVDLTEDSFTKASNESSFTTVILNITENIREPLSTTPTAAPTEVTTTTVATTIQNTETNPPQSTKLNTTTTAMPEITTTTPSTVATEVKMETSTLSSQATVPKKMNKPTERTPKRSTTESTVLNPATDRSVCSFENEDFTCGGVVTCYGEGMIDCTEDDEMKSQEDYQYDAESHDIETFPPSLIGVTLQKKKNLHQTLSSTSPRSTEDETTVQHTPFSKEGSEAEKKSSTDPTDPTDPTSPITTDETTVQPENREGSEGPDNKSSTDPTDPTSPSTIDETTVQPENKELSEGPNNTENTESNDEENGESTAESTIFSTSTFEEISTTESPVKNSSLPELKTFHVAALESSQRKLRVKVCRLSGGLICKPTPTLTMCKGKSYCQATSSTADTTESAVIGGVETWAIIVIAICALGGLLTICLLIYLVVTSCKKLKVQPSPEVCALNYINRGASTNEVA